MLNQMNIFDEFPEYTNTLMFLPKILLSERMLDNSTEVSGANWNLPDMLNQMNIFVEFPEYTNQYTHVSPEDIVEQKNVTILPKYHKPTEILPKICSTKRIYLWYNNYTEMQCLSSNKVLHVHINVLEHDLRIFWSLSAVISWIEC